MNDIVAGRDTTYMIISHSYLFLLIVSLTIELLTGWMGKNIERDNYQQFEWMSNDTLQLQRFAHEELDCGNWTGESIPITAAGQTLAVLDISESAHSRLMNSASVGAFMATVNASSFLMDASSFSADPSSPIADVSVTMENASSSSMDASPPPADPSSPIADASVTMANANLPLMDFISPLAESFSLIATAISFMSPTADVSPISIEDSSSFASASLEDHSSSQQNSNVALVNTDHWCHLLSWEL